MEQLKKILFESLTNSDKEYSSKKIMTFVAFNFCVITAIFDQFTKYKINVDIFNAFLLIATGQSVLSVIGNNLKNKSSTNNEPENKKDS
jgi:hypothetical protein